VDNTPANLQEQAKELETLYAIRAKDCIDSFYEFVIEFWDILNEEEIVEGWYIKYLCDLAQEIVERAIRKEPKKYDLVVNIPPGMSKSTIFSIMLGAWVWLRAPHFVIITATANYDLSVSMSEKSKKVVKSQRYRTYFAPHFSATFKNLLRFEKDNERLWSNNFGGLRYFTSVGGGIIGTHAHLIVWDDPLEVSAANSQDKRKTAGLFIVSTLATRKKDKEVTPTIGVMQRLHAEDPTGYMLKKNKKVLHIKLPYHAKFDVKPAELRKYYVNDLLDPVRLPLHVAEEQKSLLGSIAFSNQFEQEETPLDGGKIKQSWLQIVNELPLGDREYYMFIDGAYTKDTKNDPSGIDIFCRIGTTLFWIYSISLYLEMPELLRKIPELHDTHDLPQKTKVYIEPKASGKSLKQLLSKYSNINAIEITTDHTKLITVSKEEKVATAQAALEAGRLVLIKGVWNEEAILELVKFPNHTHDERIDNVCYAIDMLIYKKKKVLTAY
jgi:predicted phage terminase large subunit-like protein